MFHCTLCNHRTSNECTLECSCCCVTFADEYYRLDDTEYFGGEGSHP